MGQCSKISQRKFFVKESIQCRRGGADLCNSLNSLIYATIVQKESFTEKKAACKTSGADIFVEVERASKRLMPSILDDFTERLSKTLNEHLRIGRIDASSIFRNPEKKIPGELIYACLNFESLAEAIESAVSVCDSKAKNKKANIPKAIVSWVNREPVFSSTVDDLKTRMLPLLRDEIRANTALNWLVTAFDNSLDNIFKNVLDKCVVLKAVTHYRFKEKPLDFLEVYEVLKNSELALSIFSEETFNYIERVNSYRPPWRNDHGFVSAMYYFASVEFSYYLVASFKECSYDKNFLYSLVFFNKDNKNCDQILGEILFQAALCFPAIYYHNYYPSYSMDKNFKSYKSDINRNAFTYLAALGDSLQNWGRDTSYNCGVDNLSKIKPENYYNIEFEDSKIILYVNSKYINPSEIDSLVNSMSEYLKDIDALLEVRPCEFNQSFIS